MPMILNVIYSRSKNDDQEEHAFAKSKINKSTKPKQKHKRNISQDVGLLDLHVGGGACLYSGPITDNSNENLVNLFENNSEPNKSHGDIGPGLCTPSSSGASRSSNFRLDQYRDRKMISVNEDAEMSESDSDENSSNSFEPLENSSNSFEPLHSHTIPVPVNGGAENKDYLRCPCKPRIINASQIVKKRQVCRRCKQRVQHPSSENSHFYRIERKRNFRSAWLSAQKKYHVAKSEKKTAMTLQEDEESVLDDCEQCAICYEILVEPHKIEPCGHVFCKFCLCQMREIVLPRGVLCPMCRCSIHHCVYDRDFDVALFEKHPQRYALRKHHVTKLMANKTNYKLPKYRPPAPAQRNPVNNDQRGWLDTAWASLFWVFVLGGILVSLVVTPILFGLSLWRNVLVPIIWRAVPIIRGVVRKVDKTVMKHIPKLGRVIFSIAVAPMLFCLFVYHNIGIPVKQRLDLTVAPYVPKLVQAKTQSLQQMSCVWGRVRRGLVQMSVRLHLHRVALHLHTCWLHLHRAAELLRLHTCWLHIQRAWGQFSRVVLGGPEPRPRARRVEFAPRRDLPIHVRGNPARLRGGLLRRRR